MTSWLQGYFEILGLLQYGSILHPKWKETSEERRRPLQTSLSICYSPGPASTKPEASIMAGNRLLSVMQSLVSPADTSHSVLMEQKSPSRLSTPARGPGPPAGDLDENPHACPSPPDSQWFIGHF